MRWLGRTKWLHIVWKHLEGKMYLAEYYIALLENIVEVFMMNVRDPKMSNTSPHPQRTHRPGMETRWINKWITSVGTSLVVQWLRLCTYNVRMALALHLVAAFLLGFSGGSESKTLPTMQDPWVRSLGWEDPLEKGMATHSSILAWRIPWTEEPVRLQTMGSKRVGHDWVTFTFMTRVGLPRWR